jgi:C4-dicarboxylate-specific signal transduction histidine kinase
MTESREQRLRGQGFGFFGAITASLSHEINNVLATINELSGLLGDFLVAAENGGELNPERLKRPTERIAAQVKRGQTYVKCMNQFAHTVDHMRTEIDLNETVEAITTLCRRFGTLRRVELEVILPESSPRLEGSPFDAQHVLYRCIDIGLRASQQGDTLHIHVEAHDDGARATIRSDSAPEDAADLKLRHEFVELLAGELGVELTSELRADAPIALTVDFPRSLGTLSPCASGNE